ncbi:MAG TPA: hypothetical protein VNF24_07775 [Candidatus Acidoferrales bacterium]|nr:hypothetical protein [Candidatus Acidoferrales bacterium]HVC40062.1 hypothetical protein [Candidatus Dormibacteraeota bacterium]
MSVGRIPHRLTVARDVAITRRGLLMLLLRLAAKARVPPLVEHEGAVRAAGLRCRDRPARRQ